ncbi:hypothetical protein RUW49_12320 [Citrobacter freundii]|uniref:hypothetical protein n=1 Tax=Citrobacter freundii complex TaxID=1344959 RepID=UPI000651CA54|nr:MULTISPECIES: hypothetical protein [Citrobacter freundii complex]KLV38234.1 hypothetical protein SK31_04537 [Citrobacter sp. MGH99]MDT9808181.1 hypothetical protein [Citrobacter freundii]MDT9844869.1 hypothetical protein [Citrobacter freundii]
MLKLKSTIAAAAILLSVSTYADANDIKTLQKQLKPWQPMEITTKNNALMVILPGKEITPDSYNNLIMSGVCSPIWTHDTPASYLKEVKELSIVNQYKSIGYVFSDPLKTCNEIAPLMEKPGLVLLSSKTRLYTGK